MSRLSDSEKRQIVELYRQPGETTLTLADRYGVSNTTISRILKSSLPAPEYDALIQQKRFSSRHGGEPPTPAAIPVQGNLLEPPATSKPVIRSLEPASPKKKIASPTPVRKAQKGLSAFVEESAAALESAIAIDPRSGSDPNLKRPLSSEPLSSDPQTAALAEIIAEDLIPTPDGLIEDDDDDDLEDDLEEGLDDDDFEGEEGEEGQSLPPIHLTASDSIQVLPLTEATIPRTCYLVVDRSAELIARPLKEFAELGQIPSEEVQARTLPIFDNHRVAKRFSNLRTQRVIKVPDSRVLQKSASHLQAKGITRLLIDGQVYAL